VSHPLLPLSLPISFFAPTRPVCRHEREREREREKEREKGDRQPPQTSILATRVVKGKGAIAEGLQGSSGSLSYSLKARDRRRKEGRREGKMGERYEERR